MGDDEGSELKKEKRDKAIDLEIRPESNNTAAPPAESGADLPLPAVWLCVAVIEFGYFNK